MPNTIQEITQETVSSSVASKVETHEKMIRYLLVGIVGSMVLLSYNIVRENSLYDKVSRIESNFKDELYKKQAIIDCFEYQFQNYWDYPKCFKQ